MIVIMKKRNRHPMCGDYFKIYQFAISSFVISKPLIRDNLASCWQKSQSFKVGSMQSPSYKATPPMASSLTRPDFRYTRIVKYY